jgi:hypothetical protein
MRQTCNKAYWAGMETVLERNGDPENPGQPCGKTFDDFDHSTICPHEYFAPSPSIPPAIFQETK